MLNKLRIDASWIHMGSLPGESEFGLLLSTLCTSQLREFEWSACRHPSALSYSPLDIITRELSPHCLKKLRLCWYTRTIAAPYSQATSLLDLLRSQSQVREMVLRWDGSMSFPENVLPRLEKLNVPAHHVQLALGRRLTSLALNTSLEAGAPPLRLDQLQHLVQLGDRLTRLSVGPYTSDQDILPLIPRLFPSLIELDIMALSLNPDEFQHEERDAVHLIWSLHNQVSQLSLALTRCNKLALHFDHRSWMRAKETTRERMWIVQDISSRSTVLKEITLNDLTFVRVDVQEWKVYRWFRDKPLDIGDMTEINDRYSTLLQARSAASR